MHILRFLNPLALAGLLLFACAAAAQSAPSPAASSATPANTVVHATTNLVQVDVVVTDHGKPVHDIERSRFHLFEDGHEQAITAFEEHQPSPALPNASSVAARIAALPPHTYTNASSYPDTGVVNVFLLDALNTPMADQQQARIQMIEYLSKIPSGTPIAIFALASHLQMLTGFTTDAAFLAKAMKGKAGSPSHSVVLEDQASSAQMVDEQILANMENSPSGNLPNADAVAEIEQFEEDLTATQTTLRVKVTVDALQQLGRYLAAIPGRKNLIWFSGSFPITIDPEDDVRSPGRNTQDFGDEIRKASDLFTAARVAVYPIDARGLMTSPTLDARNARPSSGTNGKNSANDNTKFEIRTSEEDQSMVILAEETGGKAIFGSNDLEGAVESDIEDGSNYYTLAYSPASLKLDHSFHRIKVTVDKGRERLAYREGYFADPGYGPGIGAQNPEGAKPIASAILHGAPPLTQILLQARVLPSTDPEFKQVAFPTDPAGQMAADIKGPVRRYVVDLSIDPRGITFNDAANGSHAARIEFLLVGYDAQGKRVNFQDQTLDFALRPKHFESVMANGLGVRIFLDMPAGPGSLRIAVQDLNAGRAGSLEVPVQAAR